MRFRFVFGLLAFGERRARRHEEPKLFHRPRHKLGVITVYLCHPRWLRRSAAAVRRFGFVAVRLIFVNHVIALAAECVSHVLMSFERRLVIRVMVLLAVNGVDVVIAALVIVLGEHVRRRAVSFYGVLNRHVANVMLAAFVRVRVHLTRWLLTAAHSCRWFFFGLTARTAARLAAAHRVREVGSGMTASRHSVLIVRHRTLLSALSRWKRNRFSLALAFLAIFFSLSGLRDFLQPLHFRLSQALGFIMKNTVIASELR